MAGGVDHLSEPPLPWPQISMLLPAPLLPKLQGSVGLSNHLQSAVQMVGIRADDLS